MKWWGRLVSVAVLGCAPAPPPVLSIADWQRPQPPAAACEAQVVGSEGPIWLRRYDAEGRLTFGKTMRRASPRASEWFTWRGKDLVAVDSYLENDGSTFTFIQPEWRAIAHAELEWRDGRLVHVTQVRRAYARAFENGFDPRDWTGERDVWRLDDKYHWDRDTTYRYRGPWLEAVGSSVRYVFEGDRPVRRQLKPGLIFWDDDHNSIWTWAGDRVSTYLWTGYVQRFEYDAAGRLVLDRLDEKDRTVRIWTFEYDARGAVRRSVDKQSSGSSGSTDARISTYQYDESGREISVSYDRQFTPAPQTPGWSNPGPVSYKTTYSGDCAKVTEAPLVPNVFEIMHAAPCFQSPGKLFEQCHWGGWFRPAQR